MKGLCRHVLLTVLLPATLVAAVPETGPPTLVASDARFEMHSGFWLNLHHVLHALAEPPSPPRSAGITLAPSRLEETESEAWNHAVQAYRSGWSKRDLLFDDEMMRIKAALARAGNDLALTREGVPEDLYAALARAAPVYRSRLWSIHDALNREWSSTVRPLLAEHGDGLAKETAAALGEPWTGPVRVDLVVVGNWAGAYTTRQPTHVVVGTSDPRYRGSAALEMLFHEAAHGLIEPVRTLVREEAEHLHVTPPRQLWHAVLFYTVGELTRRRVSGHTPYADRYGLWERGSFAGVRAPIARHWQAHIDGRLGAREAIRAVLQETGGAGADRGAALSGASALRSSAP